MKNWVAEGIASDVNDFRPSSFSCQTNKQYFIWKLTYSAKTWYPIEVAEVGIAALGGHWSGQDPGKKKFDKKFWNLQFLSSFRIFLTVLYLMNLTLIRNARAYLVSKKVMHFYSDLSDKEKSDVACGANWWEKWVDTSQRFNIKWFQDAKL